MLECLSSAYTICIFRLNYFFNYSLNSLFTICARLKVKSHILCKVQILVSNWIGQLNLHYFYCNTEIILEILLY